MRSTCKRKFTLALSGLLPGVLLAWALPLCAQPVRTSRPAPDKIAAYDAAHEVTINGTVQQVVTKHNAGSPAGMHLLVSGTTGTVDAHVGPFLSKSMQQALHTGLPLQVVGAMATTHGKQYLLARQLNYGGQTVTVRGRNGSILRPAQSSASPNHKRIVRSRLSGGAR
jgi:hypothetical protein